MYPDAVSIVRVDEEYTWWLNPNLIGLNTFELAGLPLDVTTRDGAEPVRVTSGATVGDVRRDGGTLIMSLAYPPGERSQTLIAGLASSTRVMVEGNELVRVDDLDAAPSGAQWLPDLGLLAVKVPHAPHGRVSIEIRPA